MNCWTDKTVTISDSWGPGIKDVLWAPLGAAVTFTLRGRYLRDARGTRQLAQIQAEFSSGFLCDGWQGAIFTPLGTNPVKGIVGLPAWDPSQQSKYQALIDGPNTNLGDSGTLRLEGVIPYVDSKGQVGFDTVRLYYAFNAVQGAIPDLVIVKTATLVGTPGTVQVLQDGAGHGPPG